MRIEGSIIVSVATLGSPLDVRVQFYPSCFACTLWIINLTAVICDLFFQGFDEFMNLVMDEAQEVYHKSENRRQIGMHSSVRQCLQDSLLLGGGVAH